MMTPAEFRAAREDLGLSQRAMARQLGISDRSLLTYETRAEPIPRTVELAMTALQELPELMLVDA